MVTTPAQTDERLLIAAEKLFATHGYDGTSVRDITEAADCNVASVNYYFSGKAKLYEAVVQKRIEALAQIRMPALHALRDQAEPPTLEEIIRTFSKVFIEPLQNERGELTVALFMREMMDPKLPKGFLRDKAMGPYMQIFGQLIHKLYPNADPRTIFSCMFSLISQLVHSLKMQRVLRREELEFDPTQDTQAFIEHMVTFCTAGFKAALEESNA